MFLPQLDRRGAPVVSKTGGGKIGGPVRDKLIAGLTPYIQHYWPLGPNGFNDQVGNAHAQRFGSVTPDSGVSLTDLSARDNNRASSWVPATGAAVYAPMLSIPTTYSIAMTVQFDDLSGTRYLFDQNNTRYIYWLAGSGLVAGFRVPTGGYSYTTVPAVNFQVGQTYRIISSYDGATLRTFVNGVLMASAPYSIPASASPLAVSIGNSLVGGSFPFSGLMQDVWIMLGAVGQGYATALEGIMQGTTGAAAGGFSPDVYKTGGGVAAGVGGGVEQIQATIDKTGGGVSSTLASYDSLTDSDTTAIAQHVGETGGSYTRLAGAGSASIINNELQNLTGSNPTWLSNQPVGAAGEFDITASLDQRTMRTTGIETAVVYNATANAQNRYEVRYNSNFSTQGYRAWQISVVSANTAIATYTADPMNMTIGVYSLRIQYRNGWHIVTVDDVEVLRVYDTQLTPNVYWGFRGYTSNQPTNGQHITELTVKSLGSGATASYDAFIDKIGGASSEAMAGGVEDVQAAFQYSDKSGGAVSALTAGAPKDSLNDKTGGSSVGSTGGGFKSSGIDKFGGSSSGLIGGGGKIYSVAKTGGGSTGRRVIRRDDFATGPSTWTLNGAGVVQAVASGVLHVTGSAPAGTSWYGVFIQLAAPAGSGMEVRAHVVNRGASYLDVGIENKATYRLAPGETADVYVTSNSPQATQGIIAYAVNSTGAAQTIDFDLDFVEVTLTRLNVGGGAKSLALAKSGGSIAGSVAGGAKNPIAFKAGGGKGVGVSGGTKTPIASKTAGALSAGVAGGAKASAWPKTGGGQAIGKPGGNKFPLTSKTGGGFSIGKPGGNKFPISSKTGGGFSVARTGGAKNPFISKTGGGKGAGIGGGWKFAVSARTGGGRSIAIAGGIESFLYKPSNFIVRRAIAHIGPAAPQLVHVNLPGFKATAWAKFPKVAVADPKKLLATGTVVVRKVTAMRGPYEKAAYTRPAYPKSNVKDPPKTNFVVEFGK